MKVLVVSSFTASLVSTIRQPSTVWIVITVILGVASAVVGLISFAANTLESG